MQHTHATHAHARNTRTRTQHTHATHAHAHERIVDSWPAPWLLDDVNSPAGFPRRPRLIHSWPVASKNAFICAGMLPKLRARVVRARVHGVGCACVRVCVHVWQLCAAVCVATVRRRACCAYMRTLGAGATAHAPRGKAKQQAVGRRQVRHACNRDIRLWRRVHLGQDLLRQRLGDLRVCLCVQVRVCVCGRVCECMKHMSSATRSLAA